MIAVCAQLKEEGLISLASLHKIRHTALDLEGIREIIEARKRESGGDGAAAKAMARLEPLFDGSLRVERRTLDDGELRSLGAHLEDYFRTFSLGSDGLKRVLASDWTVIGVQNDTA